MLKKVHAEIVVCRAALSDDGIAEEVLVPDGHVKNRNGAEWFIDDEAWAEIEKAFKANGVHLQVDVNHESTKDVPAKEALGAVGWVDALRYEKGKGIVGRIQWNEEGQTRVKSKRFRYLSPVIYVRGDKRAVGFDSIGLVNKPAIPGMEPVASMEAVTPETKETSMDEMKLIRNALGAGDSEPVDALVKKIAENKGGLETAQAVANSARKALGLKDDAGAAEIGVAVNSLKQASDSAKADAERLKAVENKLAEREAKDLVEPFIRANKINPNAVEDLAMCTELARSNPERFKKLMNERQPYAQPGRTQPPPAGAATGSAKEDELIANALKEHKGNYATAMSALQAKLKQPFIEQGLTGRAANERCREQYPKIFAV